MERRRFIKKVIEFVVGLFSIIIYGGNKCNGLPHIPVEDMPPMPKVKSPKDCNIINSYRQFESLGKSDLEKGVMSACVYDVNTGKTREIDLSNPADMSICALQFAYKDKDKDIGFTSIDWDDFEGWSKYCNKVGLKLKNIHNLYLFGKSLLDRLVFYAEQGEGFIYWDGGMLKVVYGLPEDVASQIRFLGFDKDISDDNKST